MGALELEAHEGQELQQAERRLAGGEIAGTKVQRSAAGH